MTSSQVVCGATPQGSRDRRIDLFRGLALVMAFIDHVPGTIWEHFTSRNFGFSDAAEAFVLISGISTGLAYGPAFIRRTTLRDAARPWRRALTLWWVQLLISLAILVLFAVTRSNEAVAELAARGNIEPALDDPLSFALPLVSLGHQFHYADIFPLYVVLMLAAPGLLAIAVRWPTTLMATSLGLWFAAGQMRINIPTWPLDGGWFFNPLAWQVLFVAGILTGVSIRQGRRWIPARRITGLCAWTIVLISAVWMQVPAVASWGDQLFGFATEKAGLPPFLMSLDKTYVALPILLHILAMAYLVSTLSAAWAVSQSPKASALTLLGRHSLLVFATGTVLAYVGQVVKATHPGSAVLDAGLIGGGLVVLLLVAALRDGQFSRCLDAYRARGADEDVALAVDPDAGCAVPVQASQARDAFVIPPRESSRDWETSHLR